MITYILSRLGRVLRETLAPAVASPLVTVSRTHYLVRVDDNTLHHVRRDRVCDCGGTPQFPCPAISFVQDYLAAGGPRPVGRHESTWPEIWLRVPPLCPVCDCPTIPDRYLNSRAGPGWQCSLTSCEHFWMVRMNPLRRYLTTHRPPPRYPWHDTAAEERRAWLEAHCHPPRLIPTPSSVEAPLPTTSKSLPEHYPLALPLQWPDPAVLHLPGAEPHLDVSGRRAPGRRGHLLGMPQPGLACPRRRCPGR